LQPESEVALADNLIQNYLIDGSTSLAVLKKTLDAQSMRQKAHSQNIANAETPGYHPVKVDFENQLKSALESSKTGELGRNNAHHLQSGGAGSIQSLQPQIYLEEPSPDNPGVNGVDIDTEMAQMAETQIQYMAALELLKRRYAGLKSAIRGQ
jgi:flagellar basal-body rod protein FlgB